MRAINLLAGMLIILLVAGCEDDGDDYRWVGAPIGGMWHGYYQSPSRHEELTAQIVQDETNVTITTTLVGVGHEFHGLINGEAHLWLIDQYDREIWTSRGAVTSTNVVIRDYLWDPALGGDSPMQYIFLYR